MASPLYKGCDHRLRLTDVKDVAGAPINNGTATFTLTRTRDGEELASGSLSYLLDSAGVYYVTIDRTATADVEPNEKYRAVVAFTNPAGDDATFYLDLYGKLRGL